MFKDFFTRIIFIPMTFTAVCFLNSPAASFAKEPLFATPDSDYTHVRVKEVVSADTVYLDNDEKVTLIGLKAPEVPMKKKVEYDQFGFVIEKRTPLQTVEERALAFAKDLLEGKDVRLEFDSQRRGAYKTILAYVYLIDSGLCANEEILRQGYSSLSLTPPNLKYADQFRAAYQEARREQRGIHGE